MVSIERATTAFMAAHQFIGPDQTEAMANLARGGEESQHWREKIVEIQGVVETMPRIYEQDGKGDEAIVSLHYFRGDMDWWITERDTSVVQHQCFGLADLGMGCAELGYISLLELFSVGAELDCYWTIKTLGEVKASKVAA